MAQATGFGACGPGLPSRARYYRRLVNQASSGGAVGEAFHAGACEDADGPLIWVVAEELVGACHGDDELAGFAG